MNYYRIASKRDENKEVPANFHDFMNLYSLESITCITLDTKLGLLGENIQDANADALIKVTNLNCTIYSKRKLRLSFTEH